MGLRSNQRNGYAFEAYAVSSSKVQKIEGIAKTMAADPVRYPLLKALSQQAKSNREQARGRLDPLDQAEADLSMPQFLTPEEIKATIKLREQLVGEIFIRLFRIELIEKEVRDVLGA